MKGRNLILILLFFISACQPQSNTFTDFERSDVRSDQEVLPFSDAVPSSNADSYVGQTATVRIERAYCTYRPDIDGRPTFCNDAPYPTHDFTLLIWGSDWSDYNGHCLLVTGYISRYEGKPEIVAESRSQVSYCD